jgi:hypothetical protein
MLARYHAVGVRAATIADSTWSGRLSSTILQYSTPASLIESMPRGRIISDTRQPCAPHGWKRAESWPGGRHSSIVAIAAAGFGRCLIETRLPNGVPLKLRAPAATAQGGRTDVPSAQPRKARIHLFQVTSSALQAFVMQPSAGFGHSFSTGRFNSADRTITIFARSSSRLRAVLRRSTTSSCRGLASS